MSEVTVPSAQGATMGAGSDKDGVWTIMRILQWSTTYLKERSPSPRLDAELLLAHALGMSRVQLYTHFDKPLSVAEREPFKQFLKRRGAGEPVSYITGTKEFMSLSFTVSKAVLIPRADTEVLVEAVLAEAETEPKCSRILDIGTGSGCIAISLALKLPDVQVSAWDKDPEAIELARANAQRLGATTLRFAQVDALAEAAWEGPDDPAQRYDFIVSNPPYIALDEVPSLALSVINYEPRHALLDGGDGLAFYRMFASHAARLLRPDGKLLVEIGSTQAQAVTDIFTTAGWAQVRLRKDYAKLDRVLIISGPPASSCGGLS